MHLLFKSSVSAEKEKWMKAVSPFYAIQDLIQDDQRAHRSEHPDHVVISGLSQDKEGRVAKPLGCFWLGTSPSSSSDACRWACVCEGRQPSAAVASYLLMGIRAFPWHSLLKRELLWAN